MPQIPAKNIDNVNSDAKRYGFLLVVLHIANTASSFKTLQKKQWQTKQNSASKLTGCVLCYI